MGAYVARLLAYLALPLLPTPWLLLPVELLQGATFALAWSAGTVHVKRISPPHLRSTVQSLFQGLYTGIGEGRWGGRGCGRAGAGWRLNAWTNMCPMACPSRFQGLAWAALQAGCCMEPTALQLSFELRRWPWRSGGWRRWLSCMLLAHPPHQPETRGSSSRLGLRAFQRQMKAMTRGRMSLSCEQRESYPAAGFERRACAIVCQSLIMLVYLYIELYLLHAVDRQASMAG
jgi:hypothetical protein